jgi:hypothetical protein
VGIEKDLKNSAFTKFRAQLHAALTSSTRQLSMVFFIGRGRAHTYRVPLVFVYAFVIGLSSVVVWGISSIGLVSYYSQQNQWLEQQLNLTRDIVFKYQTQYENIYERSYPNVSQQESDRALDAATAQIEGENRPKQEEIAAAKVGTIDSVPADAEGDEDSLPTMDNRLIAEAEARAQAAEIAALDAQRKAEEERVRKLAEDEKAKAAATAAATKAEEKASEAQSAPVAAIEKTATATAPAQQVTPIQPPAPVQATAAAARSGQLGQRDVAVRNLKLIPNASGVDVNFSIQNSSNIPKAQGYMYVIGKFVTTTGRTQFVAAPAGIDVNINSGEARQATQGESFSVARGRPAKFSLTSPVGDVGRFVEVQIVLTDRDGKQADELRQSVKSSDIATKDPTTTAQ